MLKMDFTRNYNQTHPPAKGPGAPEDEMPALYSQDGLYFNVHGDLVESMTSEKDRARIKKMVARQAAEEAAEEAKRASLLADGEDPDDPEMNPGKPAGEPAKTATIDLIAWARGQQRYAWATIQKAFKDQHAMHITNKQAATSWLVDNSLVEQDEIKV